MLLQALKSQVRGCPGRRRERRGRRARRDPHCSAGLSRWPAGSSALRTKSPRGRDVTSMGVLERFGHRRLSWHEITTEQVILYAVEWVNVRGAKTLAAFG